MALPGVNIEILNGQLGRVAGTADGVAGLIGTGVAASGLALGTPKQIFGTEDAKALGIDDAYDTANATDLYRQIKDFYAQAGEGAELWIMIVSNTTTLTNMVDSAGNIAPALLDAAEGRIRLLGITRNPAGTYVPAVTSGLDDDAKDAVMAAQTLATNYAGQYKPVRVLVEGRAFQGTASSLYDFRGGTQNRAGIVLQGLGLNKKSAAVGLALGRMAAEPVQRDLGRVKSGDLNLSSAYLSDGQKIETYSLGEWGQIHNKGYIFARKFQGKSGYYFNGSVACTAITDDYSSLARGRVIDKALVITYTTYVNEILDDIEIDADGYMAPAVVKSYQAKIETAINENMTRKEEISGVSCQIDPRQNVLATDKVSITLSIRPKGYTKNIEVKLGFSNPQA